MDKKLIQTDLLLAVASAFVSYGIGILSSDFFIGAGSLLLGVIVFVLRSFRKEKLGQS